MRAQAPLYLCVSSANKCTVLLTAAHVARPLPAFTKTGVSRRHNSQAAKEIMEMKAIAITSMLSAIGDLCHCINILFI